MSTIGFYRKKQPALTKKRKILALCSDKEPTIDQKEVTRMNNKYQILYIIKIDTTDEQRQALVEKFSELVASLDGEVVAVDKWGVKKFAYPIDYKKEGYYVLMKFNAPASAPIEIERQMKINDGIVRQMITRI